MDIQSPTLRLARAAVEEIAPPLSPSVEPLGCKTPYPSNWDKLAIFADIRPIIDATKF
jgi:hypothetical protein